MAEMADPYAAETASRYLDPAATAPADPVEQADPDAADAGGRTRGRAGSGGGGGLRGDVLRFLEMVPLAGALLYALGWTAAARFYSEFDVAPEEVGIDFGYMLVRVSYFVVGVAGATLLVWRLAKKHRGFQMPEWLANVATSIGTIGLMAILGNATRSLVTQDSAFKSLLWSVVYVAMVAIGYTALQAWQIARYRNGQSLGEPHTYVLPLGRRQITLQVDTLSLLQYFGVTLLLVIVIVYPLFLATRAADTVRSGNPYTVDVLPGVRGFAVESVQVKPADIGSSDRYFEDRCVLHLGTAHGSVVVFDSESNATYRLAVEAVEVESPC
jgi:hypothetical protein